MDIHDGPWSCAPSRVAKATLGLSKTSLRKVCKETETSLDCSVDPRYITNCTLLDDVFSHFPL